MTHPMLEAMRRLDDVLAPKGWPRLSPFWWETFELVYDSEKRQHVWRVGRQGGKTTTLCRLAVCEAHYGDHKIPTGTTGTILVVSADLPQSKEIVLRCREILRELNIEPTQETADTLRWVSAHGRAVRILARPCSISGVVSMTCIGVICDEVAKWRDNERGGNIAKEVLASIRPTMITQRKSKLFMISSPMGVDDVHAQAFDKGTNDFQTAHFAESWKANPSITIEDCRALAENDREFKREYECIPQGAFEHGFYDFQALLAASDKERGPEPAEPRGFAYAFACDPGFLHDCFALAIAHAEEHDGRVRVVLDYYKELRAPITPDAAIGFATGMRSLWPGGFGIIGDQASGALLTSEFAKKGVMYVVDPWSAASLVEKHSAVRDLLANGALSLPKWGDLQKQLAKLGVKLTAGGQETIASADGHIGDAASAAVAAIFEAWKHAPMQIEAEKSPFPTFGRRIEGLNTPSSGGEGDEKYTESTHCAICGSKRGECPHTG